MRLYSALATAVAMASAAPFNGVRPAMAYPVHANANAASDQLSTVSTTVRKRRLPPHTLVGYWHNFANPSGPTFPLREISSDWDVIVVAFGSSVGGGTVKFDLDPAAGTEAQFISDISTLQGRNKTVVLSLGGQDGTVSLNDAAETARFVDSVAELLAKYGFDGIDLDVETGISQGLPIVNNLISAVKQIKQRVGDSFYLSMAPEHPYVQGGAVSYGSIWGAYLPIIDGLRDELTQIHVQYYNNGGFVYTDGRMLQEGTVDCLVGGSLMLINGFETNYGKGWRFRGLRPDQVSFGVPSGPQAAGRGFASADTLQNAVTCIAQGVGCDTIRPTSPHPTFRGIMTWSINWDRFDQFEFSRNARAALDGLPQVVQVGSSSAVKETTATTAQVRSVPAATLPTAPKNCGRCDNCYYSPTNACFSGWTKAQCRSVSVFTWCG
ncbi:hypothetical protein H310_05405 [Aphanomyces invadans]|uniref:chitinase n=1 Tax=Aphanomyces invadans TaxID=157072 RepID=A0A024U9M7_9STRA|nr:hypothetical protein H310_05405 [Aphanomyces invadans]ETW02964.1 hypothetical protein H310_05405 [Aphanomyces invadans]RHY25534.1 hypothetical protein DYB32_008253 [Aphanomyces invadans]|eukprot:XP_008868348.1 hypothetical protein H310_05405 [Aphanomyces invadans]